MQLDLTDGEAQALKQLIHFAVQARGMEVAEAAVVLVKKIDGTIDANRMMNGKYGSIGTPPPRPDPSVPFGNPEPPRKDS